MSRITHLEMATAHFEAPSKEGDSVSVVCRMVINDELWEQVIWCDGSDKVGHSEWEKVRLPGDPWK